MRETALLDISSKDYVSIEDGLSLNEAIHLMQESSVREVIVIRNSIHKYGLLTTKAIIAFKLEGVDFTLPMSELKLDTISTLHTHNSLLEAFDEMSDSCNCLCLLDENEQLSGFITYHDIISSIDPKVLMAEQKIRDILWETFVRQIAAHTKTIDVLKLMNMEGFESIIVYEETSAVGIITNKDVVTILDNGVDLENPIGMYMSKPLQTINEHTSIKYALEYIQEKNFKRIIVSNDNNAVIGQISQSELLAKVYSKWADNLHKNDSELKGLNKILEQKADKFEQMAQIDRLTGIVNRNKFEQIVLIEIDRYKRYKEEFSLVFFDIDYFKKVNDKYGHLTGDVILQEVSTVVKSLTRTVDVLARWGGEEFVVVLPKTKQSDAVIAAQKYCDGVASHIFTTINQLTCSFGVASFQEGDTITSIIHRADEAMYQAKKSGRNQVCTLS